MAERGAALENQRQSNAQQLENYRKSLTNYQDYIKNFGTLAPTTRGTDVYREFNDPQWIKDHVQQLSALGIDTSDPYRALYGSAWNTPTNTFSTGNSGSMLNGYKIGTAGGQLSPELNGAIPTQYAWGNDWNHVAPGQIDNLLATGATLQNGGLKYDPTYGLLYNKNIQVDTGESKNSFERFFQKAVPVGIAMMAGYGAGMSYIPGTETAAGAGTTAIAPDVASAGVGGIGDTGAATLGTGAADMGATGGGGYFGGIGGTGFSGTSIGLQTPAELATTAGATGSGLTITPAAAGGFIGEIPSAMALGVNPQAVADLANLGNAASTGGNALNLGGSAGALSPTNLSNLLNKPSIPSIPGVGGTASPNVGQNGGGAGSTGGILGNLIGSGLQYNAGNQLNDLADKMTSIADPFSSQRSHYQDILRSQYDKALNGQNSDLNRRNWSADQMQHLLSNPQAALNMFTLKQDRGDIDSLRGVGGQAAADAQRYAGRINNYYDNPSSFKLDPAYQAQFKLGQEAAQRAAAARGMNMSGNVLSELTQYGSDLAAQAWNTELNRLTNYVNANRQNATNAFTNAGNLTATMDKNAGDYQLQGLNTTLSGLNNLGNSSNNYYNTDMGLLSNLAGVNAGNPGAAAKGLSDLGTMGIADKNAAIGNVVSGALGSSVGQKVGGVVNGAVDSGLNWLGNQASNWWDTLGNNFWNKGTGG